MKPHMIFSKLTGNPWVRNTALVAGALALAACATMETDDTTGSHLQQPAAGTPPEPTVEAGDIAIAAQEFSHSIRDLPQVANAGTPPLVRFAGVTSIVRDENRQLVAIDTEPYTTLLRDRLLLGDREKLRFVERTLPPLNAHPKHEKSAPVESGDADYRVLAELRGRYGDDSYRIQMEFVDAHSGEVLFSATYRIHKESSGSNGGDMSSEYAPPAASNRVAPESTAPETGERQAPAPPGYGPDRTGDVPSGMQF
jgi:PBP1b-binding outer membrane lipoprotein LpoB